MSGLELRLADKEMINRVVGDVTLDGYGNLRISNIMAGFGKGQAVPLYDILKKVWMKAKRNRLCLPADTVVTETLMKLKHMARENVIRITTYDIDDMVSNLPEQRRMLMIGATEEMAMFAGRDNVETYLAKYEPDGMKALDPVISEMDPGLVGLVCRHPVMLKACSRFMLSKKKSMEISDTLLLETARAYLFDGSSMMIRQYQYKPDMVIIEKIVGKMIDNRRETKMEQKQQKKQYEREQDPAKALSKKALVFTAALAEGRNDLMEIAEALVNERQKAGAQISTEKERRKKALRNIRNWLKYGYFVGEGSGYRLTDTGRTALRTLLGKGRNSEPSFWKDMQRFGLESSKWNLEEEPAEVQGGSPGGAEAPAQEEAVQVETVQEPVQEAAAETGDPGEYLDRAEALAKQLPETSRTGPEAMDMMEIGRELALREKLRRTMEGAGLDIGTVDTEFAETVKTAVKMIEDALATTPALKADCLARIQAKREEEARARREAEERAAAEKAEKKRQRQEQITSLKGDMSALMEQMKQMTEALRKLEAEDGEDE